MQDYFIEFTYTIEVTSESLGDAIDEATTLISNSYKDVDEFLGDCHTKGDLF